MSARARKPPTAPPRRPSLDDQPTTVFDADDTAESQADPTVVDRPVAPAMRAGSKKAPPIQVISKKDPSAPIQVMSAPIQAISMKTPGTHDKPPLPENPPTPILARPKLRAVSELAAPKQQNLGNLASPYDPKAARARAMREYVIWGCLAVILASAIALVVWFTAR